MSRVSDRLALGTVPLGNYRRAISDTDAIAIADRAWERGIRAYDTAPLYGSGLAETRLGKSLHGRPRKQYRLSTKVGNLLSAEAPARADLLDEGRPIYLNTPTLNPVVDFSRDGVLRSLEGSMRRLGTDYIDTVYLHDPLFDTPLVLDQAYPTLEDLKDQGVIGAIGIGGSDITAFLSFSDHARIDAMLVASRLTLLDFSGVATLLPFCLDHHITVVAGAIFNSGILAAADPSSSSFGYRRPTQDTVTRVASLRAVCSHFGVSPVAAALQFPLRFTAVGSVVVGAGGVDELDADVDAFIAPVPQPFWDAVREWQEQDARVFGASALRFGRS